MLCPVQDGMCSVPYSLDTTQEGKGQTLSSIVLLSLEFHTMQLHVNVPCMFFQQVRESCIGP